MESSSSVSIHAPTINKNENSESSDMEQSNVENEPVWSKPSNGDSVIWPVMGVVSWPTLSEMKKSPSNNSSSDPLRSMNDGSSRSSSSSVSFYQNDHNASMFANGTVAQPSGQNQMNKIASASHGGNQNQYQWKSYKNPNGNHHPHQSHGGRHNYEHGNQNFDGRGGFAQAYMPGFVRYASPLPPPLSPIFAPYILPTHQPFYHFSNHMAFHDLAPPLMCYHSPPRVPFMRPHAYQVQEASLKTRIRNQVHYYFSEENLKTDHFMRMRMNDDGFVHIQFIAGFNKLKALTCNIQLILDALQGSYHVELKGYEIRSRHKWRKYLLPLHLRVPYYPSLARR